MVCIQSAYLDVDSRCRPYSTLLGGCMWSLTALVCYDLSLENFSCGLLCLNYLLYALLLLVENKPQTTCLHLPSAVPENCWPYFFLQIASQVALVSRNLCKEYLNKLLCQTLVLFLKNLSSLPYRKSFRVIMYVSYKVWKAVRFLAHPVHLSMCRVCCCKTSHVWHAVCCVCV